MGILDPGRRSAPPWAVPSLALSWRILAFQANTELTRSWLDLKSSFFDVFHFELHSMHFDALPEGTSPK